MLVTLALALSLAAEQAPRDAPAATVAARTGTGIIKGRVVAADTGTPVRRALVTIAGPGAPPRTIYTDGAGRYEARNLAPGSYSVMARPNSYQAQFLPAPAPPLSPDGSPRRVPLADGQTLEWHDLTLPRAGAIAGRIVDEHGDPVSGISVAAQRVGDPPRFGNFASQPSDELGRYRLYRLAPGDYQVVARPTSGFDNAMGVNLGFGETYYPGTFSREEAGRLRVRAGQETAASDLQLTYARMLQIRGMVVDSKGTPAAGASVSLNSDAGGGMGTGVDPQGRFSFRSQPPGQYRLAARMLSENREVTTEYASARLTLTDADIDDLVVTMRPTVTISGRVTFDGAAAPALRAGALTIRAEVKDRSSGSQLSVSPAPVAEDLTFTVRNLAGDLLLRPSGGLPGGWSLKAVLFGSDDITDVPRDFRAEDSGRVQIVLTNRWSEVSGVVTGDDGKPAARGTVILFGEDKATWFAESSRMRAAGILPGGRFVFRGLRPGRYHLVALPPDVRWDFQAIDTAALETYAREGTAIVLGEDEQRQVDLRLAIAGGKD